MPALKVKRSIHINAPVKKVYQNVSDLKKWTSWSPWLIVEPEAEVNVSEDLRSYSWKGKRVGSGNMNITATQDNSSVDYDLTFLTPWKSTAKVRFEVKPEDDGTLATWYMDSSLPFYLFWMKKMMAVFIGMDYERGLKLLKDYSEDGKVHSKLDWKGETTYPGCRYVAIKTTASIKDMSNAMQKDFRQLMGYLSDKQGLIGGEPFTVYHKWDLTGDKVIYTAGVPMSGIPDNLPDSFVQGSLPEMKIYKLRHTGPYHHLGNAWSTMMNMARGKEFRQKKALDPFETYVNSPEDTAERELVTDINFPIKG